jgi:hypothetical protein
MDNKAVMTLALDLLRADSEEAVIAILKHAGLWDDPGKWRLYGDKEGNFATIGGQAAIPEAALVEKIVNSCDARLMLECRLQGIEPESELAPTSVREAVRMFFDKQAGQRAGSLLDWSSAMRTDQSRFITLAATGDRPTRGHTSRKMCLTIVDQAEGQGSARLPKTILSFNEKNKQRIKFVQGKFNMGGSGALRFCRSGIQLVISRRSPELAKTESAADPTVMDWAVTVTRREEPTSKAGDPVHSEYTYLAPIDSDKAPRNGNVLHFNARSLPLMPEHDDAYVREIEWGTAIKLYEYQTTVGQSNVLMKDGLMYSLERLLPEIALPIRIHECRGYAGEKARSFETPIAGLVVRLEDGRGDNLEKHFPLSVQLQVGDMQMTARIYAFKEDKAETYLKDEGVIFTINGQAHGYLPKSIFSRPKSVGLPRLKDSLLVLIDCSKLRVTQREDLFMTSRDRLSKNPIRFQIEEEIEQLLKTNSELRRLQQERREQDVDSRLNEEAPLEEVLGKIFVASPTLKSLFLRGQRLARPFAGGGGSSDGNGGGGARGGASEFRGKQHPTYFRIPGQTQTALYKRNTELGRRCQIRFETDVENSYFDRAAHPGDFQLEIVDATRDFSAPGFSLGLENGVAHLNLAIPTEAEAGDRIVLQATVHDDTMLEPLVSLVQLTCTEKQERQPGPNRPKPPSHDGAGEDPSNHGIKMPHIIPVHENDSHWIKYHFAPETACHVVSDPHEEGGKTQLDHTFYINVDNNSLKTEMKYAKQDPRLLEAKFKYANVLLGLAVLHHAELHEKSETGDGDSAENESPQDTIRKVSSAMAPVMIPMIDQLSGLTEDQLGEVSIIGEEV